MNEGPLTDRPAQQAATSGDELHRFCRRHVLQSAHPQVRAAPTGHVFLRCSAAGGRPAYDEEYERSQVMAAAASGKQGGPGKKVTAGGGADDNQFADVELGDDLLPS